MQGKKVKTNLEKKMKSEEREIKFCYFFDVSID